MPQNEEPGDREMILAEFSALRAEMTNRQNLQWNVFALQLTATGVIFSFALSNPSHTGFLLILPITTYALTGRYVSQYLGVRNMAAYIRDVLNEKSNGNFGWENWIDSRPPQARTLSFLNPLFLTFPGVATIALIWAGPYVWEGRISLATRVLVVFVWFLGILVTALSAQLIARIVSRHWRLLRSRNPNHDSSSEPIVGAPTPVEIGPASVEEAPSA